MYQIKDSVIAAHPDHECSFAPGAVIDIPQEEKILVRFYDGEEALIERYQIYRYNLLPFKRPGINISFQDNRAQIE